MKKVLFIFLLGISILACDNEELSSEGIIEKEKMIQILTDVQMIESTAIFVKNKQASFDIDESYAWLFEKYSITEEEFKKSVEYYASDSKTYEEIYDQIIINLSEKQAELSRTSVQKDEENVEKPALLNAESE